MPIGTEYEKTDNKQEVLESYISWIARNPNLPPEDYEQEAVLRNIASFPEVGLLVNGAKSKAANAQKQARTQAVGEVARKAAAGRAVEVEPTPAALAGSQPPGPPEPNPAIEQTRNQPGDLTKVTSPGLKPSYMEPGPWSKEQLMRAAGRMGSDLPGGALKKEDMEETAEYQSLPTDKERANAEYRARLARQRDAQNTLRSQQARISERNTALQQLKLDMQDLQRRDQNMIELTKNVADIGLEIDKAEDARDALLQGSTDPETGMHIPANMELVQQANNQISQLKQYQQEFKLLMSAAGTPARDRISGRAPDAPATPPVAPAAPTQPTPMEPSAPTQPAAPAAPAGRAPRMTATRPGGVAGVTQRGESREQSLLNELKRAMNDPSLTQEERQTARSNYELYSKKFGIQ